MTKIKAAMCGGRKSLKVTGLYSMLQCCSLSGHAVQSSHSLKVSPVFSFYLALISTPTYMLNPQIFRLTLVTEF